MQPPYYLKHKPIVSVDYKGRDENGDAEFLSLGLSQWNEKEISAKVFRKTDYGWSRQSEELPLWRLLDLNILLLAQLSKSKSLLKEEICNDKQAPFLNNFLEENKSLYSSRIIELKD